jgi:glycosyltransferase involved in cell wall biosynthesis
MRFLIITPGAGGMYCGNCLRDNALAAALRRAGYDVLMLPLYLPMTLDEPSAASPSPMFFGGVNVYLSQQIGWYRSAPAWIRRLFDSPRILKWAAGKAAKTRAADVGELNLSMLRGEEGSQSRELDDLIVWLKQQPRPDAVLLSNALLVGFVRRLRRDLGSRVFVCLQGEDAFLDDMTEPWRSRSWATLAERGKEADGWISPSRYFGERMGGRLGLPEGKVHVAANGIRLDAYRDLPARPALAPGSPVHLGFFARMCREKGLDVVVDAFIRLRARGCRNLRLLVGGGCGPGDQPYVGELKNRILSAGLSGDVEFHPNVTHAEKAAFFGRCDVVSVPARQTEAFGLYIVEALAAGAPMVQPRKFAFPELMADTGGGIVYDGDGPEALAAALEPLVLNPAALRAFGEAGRVSVFERYTDRAMADRVVKITSTAPEGR